MAQRSDSFDRGRPKTATKVASLLVPGIAVLFLLFFAFHSTGCGGGTSSAPATGTVTTTISDPAPQCTYPNGPYEHVWVTISGVLASTSQSADSGFVNLTPNLSVTNPIQVDLLSQASTECILATLGQTSGLPPGKYQQIRLILVPNSTTGVNLTPNNCVAAGSDVYNCVETGGTPSNYYPLDTPSAGQTGIKIPPGQIAGGGITLAQNQGADIDIDFNACTSIVSAGNSGKLILKPTLRAAELGVSPLISGTVVLGQSNGPGNPVSEASPHTTIAGATVWLEQEPSAPNAIQGDPQPSPSATAAVSSVVMTTMTDSSGNFEFCPVGPGNYDIVADASSLPIASSPPSAPTILTGVPVASTAGVTGLTIPLLPQPTPSPSGTPLWAQITGEVATENVTASGDFVTLNAAQSITPSGTSTSVLEPIPLIVASSGGTLPPSGSVVTSSTPTNADCPTASSVTCPSGSNCACFTLAVPAAAPVIGSYSQTSTTFVAPSLTSTPPSYSLTAEALTQSPPQSPVCSASLMFSSPFSVQGASVTTLGNITSGVAALLFTGCD